MTWQPNQKWRWRPSGWELARRYISFFEPDLFVDVTGKAIKGLSLTPSDEFIVQANSAIAWEDFVSNDDSSFSAFTVGQDVMDIYRHLYRTRFQFVHRTPPPIAIFQECRNQGDMAFFEAVFGCFPSNSALDYLEKAYKDAFQPTTYLPSAKTFTELWKKCASPFWFGSEGLEQGYTGNDEPVIFIFDPRIGSDLIDYWNLRLFTRDVVPINVHWIKDCEGIITEALLESHRPMRNNPQGLMHRATIEFASSISEDRAKSLVESHVKNVPRDARSVKHYYSSIWDISKEDWYHRPTPIQVTADQKEAEIHIEAESDYAWIDSLTPKFADRFGGTARWANVIRIRPPIGSEDNRVLCAPADGSAKRRIPSFEAKFSKEGIVTLSSYQHERVLLKFPQGETRVCEWLGEKGLTAKLSDAGKLTKQVIDALGGLGGVQLIADVETVQELNRMAASRSVREDATRGVAVEETPPRTSAQNNWVKIVNRRKQKTWTSATIDGLTAARVMQIGLNVRCAHCQAQNWFSLTELGYELQCQRCLKDFSFPQAESTHKWAYRP